MVSAVDIPWEFVIFVLIFAVVLFYFTLFQSYLTAAIYRCIIRCILPKTLSITFKRFQFSILGGILLVHDLMITTLSMRIEISRLSVALKYWSKIPDFDENDKDEEIQNEKNIKNVDWIRSSHETNKKNKIKKKKGIFTQIFNRKSRFKVSIDGLHITLFNQSEDAISRIETFRKIFALDKKSTDEATDIYKEMFPSPPPQPYQLSIMMRIILPMTFSVNAMLVSIGNEHLPSVLFFSAKKVKGLFTMIKREDPQHSLKQRITFHMKEAKLRSIPNNEFDKSKLNPNSMRCLDRRFDKNRTIFYTDVLNVMYTQDAFGCYIRSEDKEKAGLATAEPKSNIQVGLKNAKIDYGSYTDKLRSAFMRYFKPFLFINPIVYPISHGRVKYMEITMAFFGDQPAQITVPFTSTQGLSESLVIKFDSKPESIITMAIPQYVSSVAENKMEVICNFVNPRISTSLSNSISENLETDEDAIIRSSILLVNYISFSPEKWFQDSFTKCSILFERCKTKLAPYHIDFLTDLGTDFVSTYPFEETVDDIDFFQPSNFQVTLQMVDAKIQLLSKNNPLFEYIYKIRNHQRMVIRTEMFGIYLQMPSKYFHESEKEVTFTVQLNNPILKFFLPNNNMNQFRRNCYKWAHEEAEKKTEFEVNDNDQLFDSKKKFNNNNDDDDNDDDHYVENDDDDNIDDKIENEKDFREAKSDTIHHHKYIKHEHLDCSSITLNGSYRWDKNNGNRQFPLAIKIGPTEGFVSVICIKSILAVISNYSSSTKRHPNTTTYNKAFESYVKPPPEFPDSKMHMQVNVQIVKADVGIPFDLYDTSAFLSVHAANFYLTVESYQPYFHVIIGLPSISITFNKTNTPSERFYYERIGEGIDIESPRETIHINGISFAIKNTSVTKPNVATLFSLMSLDVGEISGTISVYQLFSLLDLASNFMHLWFSFDVIQLLEPDFDSIYLPRQIQVSVRGVSIIIDFVQYGLMLVNLPTGIVVYQDNIINTDAHKAMFVNIPTIDVHHIYQPNEEEHKNTKKRKKKKKKHVTFPTVEQSSSSSHNKVVFLIDSSTTNTGNDTNNYEYEEEEEEEEDNSNRKKKEKSVTSLSKLRSVFHLTTYVSIIRRGRYTNPDYDSKLQMKHINDYDPHHEFIDFMNLPKDVKLPHIFYHYDVTLDENYTLMQTFKADPNKENDYELPIHEVIFEGQKQYANSDVSQLWLHLFQIQRFSRFGVAHQNDIFDDADPGVERFDVRRNDMHVIVSPNTTVLLNVEYIIVLMLMLKTFNLQPDSHFLSSIARNVVTDLWMDKVVKNKSTSLNLPGVFVSLFDFDRETKCDLSIHSIDLIMSDQVGVSSQMTLSVSDISLDAYSKISQTPAASLKLPLIELGKIDGDTSIHINKIIFNAPSSPPLTRLINYFLSYIGPVLGEIESPSVGVGLDDFKNALLKYIDEDENLDDYCHHENNSENQAEYINEIENEKEDNHHHNKNKKKAAKVHKLRRRKSKYKKRDVDSSQKEDESLSIFDDNESVIEDEKDAAITRFYLAYAKLCNARKSIMNFVDNYQFDDNEDDMEEEQSENNPHPIHSHNNFSLGSEANYHLNFLSENNLPTFSPENQYQNHESSHIHLNENARPNSFSGRGNSTIFEKIENEKKRKKYEKSRIIIKTGRIQFNLMNSIITIKLDPISIVSKGKSSAARVVIKSIKSDLKSDLFDFISSIEKPKKEATTAASTKFQQKKIKKKSDKQLIVHFILNSFVLRAEFVILTIDSVTALCNISKSPFVTLSLMNMLIRVDEYAQIIFGGFDFYFSKDINKGSFCLRPIEIKFAVDLILNPKACVNIEIFIPRKRKKTQTGFSQRKHKAKLIEKVETTAQMKTDKFIKKMKKFNQNETVHSLANLLDNLFFFLIFKDIKIEAVIDDNSATYLKLPGIRGGIFNTNSIRAFLYVFKPEFSITNIVSKPLIDIYMYGFYDPHQRELNLLTTSGELKIKTNKNTLSKIASLINGLLSKVPKREDQEAQEAAQTKNNSQVGRKSVANLNLITKHNSSSSLAALKPLKIKAKKQMDINELSTNALKVVNSLYNGLKVVIKFTIPKITIDLPEISSNLTLLKPFISLKCRKEIRFRAMAENLYLQIDKSKVSIKTSFTKENEEKLIQMDNLNVIVTPSLFKQINRMKEFFNGIKTELTRQENISHIFNNLNNSIQISVKKNVIKIFDPNSFLGKAGNKGKNNTPQYEIPTILSDKYVINFNNNLINLKYSDNSYEEEEGENYQDGFFIEIPSISLSLETRKSEAHSKTATAANFILKNLNIEDKNEYGKVNKHKKQNFSSVRCEETNISALSFVNHLNVDVNINSFHISVYSTIPIVISHLVSFIKTIQKDIMVIKTAKILGPRKNISDAKKLKMMARRGSLKSFQTESSYVIFDVKVVNTAVILHSPHSEISLPSVLVYGDYEKTNSTFSPQKLLSTIRIKPIQTSISTSILLWFKKLLANIENEEIIEIMKRRSSNADNISNENSTPSVDFLNTQKKPKKVLAQKLMLNVTIFLEEIDFNLGCQPSDVMLQFGLQNLVFHFTTKTDCASFKVGEIVVTTEKADDNRKSNLSQIVKSNRYRPKTLSYSAIHELNDDENSNRLLSINISPIDGMISRNVQVFNVNTLSLSVSNNEMEDLFTFIKVWVQPIMDILKEVSSIYLKNAKPKNSILTQHNENNANQPDNNQNNPNMTDQDTYNVQKIKKGQLNLSARVQSLTISFIYSGVNGKLGLEIKPVLFSRTDLSTNLSIPKIVIFATGFVKGTIEIQPVIFQLNNVKKTKIETPKISHPTQKLIRRNSIVEYKRINNVIIIKSIRCDIKSYEDPLLLFNLEGIYLFFLLLPPSDQILSLTINSSQLKMTSQAISKFKRIMSAITDPIKEGIAKTKRTTVHTEIPHYEQFNGYRGNVSTFNLSSSSTPDQNDQNLLEKKKEKKKVHIEKARMDLLLSKCNFELYRYYMTDKEAVKLTVSRAFLSVNLLEKQKKSNKNSNQITIPKIIRNMNFVFEPMALLRLFSTNGKLDDHRNVLLIPQILGSLNTIQQGKNVSYDFNTVLKDSVECSLTISDYEAVKEIVMFAIRNITNQNAQDAENNILADQNDQIYNDNMNYGIVDQQIESDEKITKKKKREYNFSPGDYHFSPQFKISLGAKIQPDVEWVLGCLGIKDEHVVPATLFQYVCVSLQDLLEYIAQSVASEI